MSAELAPSLVVRRGLVTVTALAFLLLYAPIVTVVVASFVGPDGPTLAHYDQLFADGAIGAAVERSLSVAAGTSLAAALLGTLGALAIERGRFPGRALLGTLTLLPLAMPELVLGIASLLWFATLRMTLGLHSIMLAHVTFAVSYVLVAVRASLRGFDSALIDAARDLGATSWQVHRRVILPLIAPGVLAGALMAFTLSFDDFLISFFTAGVGSDTLPMRLYAAIRFGMSREMYALSALLIVVSAVGAGLASIRFKILK